MGEELPLLREVSVTEARQMRRHYDDVVHEKRPFVITRYHDPGAVVVSRDDLARSLSQYRFVIELLPEEDGAFTLWVPELGIGESGPSIKSARAALVASVRAYVQHYWDRYAAWQHIPEKAAQWPYVLRLSLAQSDDEIAALLLESVPRPDQVRQPIGA
jgi:hypothetical protein